MVSGPASGTSVAPLSPSVRFTPVAGVAAPPASEQDTPQAQEYVHTAAQVLADAGRQFNRGQRAFFFALGYLGWFVGPLPFIVTTAGVVVVMWRRQFNSAAQHAIAKN